MDQMENGWSVFFCMKLKADEKKKKRKIGQSIWWNSWNKLVSAHGFWDFENWNFIVDFCIAHKSKAIERI